MEEINKKYSAIASDCLRHRENDSNPIRIVEIRILSAPRVPNTIHKQAEITTAAAQISTETQTQQST
jgi:hypothetical protein